MQQELQRGKLLPEPLLQFNPSYEIVGSVDSLAAAGEVHPAIAKIFRGYKLYRHQVEAMRLGIGGRNFVIS